MKQKLLLFLMALLPMAANAYYAEINGICYFFSGDEATVTFCDECYNHYSGDVIIPSSVKYNNKTYNVTRIGYQAFSSCTILTSVSIPNSVTSIDEHAFDGCTGLTSINIPNSVISIGISAFSGCTSLTSITIPNSVTTISNHAFEGCGLTSIIVEPGNTVYDSRDNCNAIIETASNTLIQGCQNTTIPNSVTNISDLAFGWCSGLTSITIPNSVTSIGESAFYSCSSLASITIPNSVTNIGASAFSFCSGLTSIIIPSSVTNMGRNPFSGCIGLTSIIVKPGNNVYDSRDNCNAIIETASNTLVIGLPNTIIPNSVTSIGESAFSNCWRLTSITIPNSVTSICESAFYNCWRLTSITIPNSVTSIGSEAFNNCTGLTSITIPNSVTSIGNCAFEGCTRLTSITIPNSVTSIARGTFAGCTDLTSITIPNSVTSIGEYAFSGCWRLTSITIPTSVTKIEEDVFNGCGLTSITIPNSVTSIGAYAFYGCEALGSITIPNSVTSIGNHVFEGCPLYQVKVYMERPVIGSNLFGDTSFSPATLYVPYGCSAAYMDDATWNCFNQIIEMQNPDEITIGSSGVATFASPNALDFSEITNVKAYVASNFDSETNTLVLTRVKESPAGEGLFVVGEPGSYVIPEKTTDATYSNLLRGVTYPTYLSTSDGEHTNFILANGSHGLGFYTLTKAGELAAGKAYLQLPVSDATEVKALSIIDDEETAIISLLDDKPERNDIYNLQGQRVSQAKHGLYIVNGKKVFNR